MNPHKRLRLTSATPHADHIDAAAWLHPMPDSREVWVDIFPPEVRERIVVHACRGLPGQVAIRLAQTSVALRNSVFSMFDYAMTCLGDSGRLPEMLCWRDLFGSDVVKLIFGGKSSQVQARIPEAGIRN